MDVHPSGDHIIVGGYDRKLCWLDLELSDKPFKVMRYVPNFESAVGKSHHLAQVPFTSHTMLAFPSDLSAICIVLRRRINTDISFAGVQRLNDRSSHCAFKDLAWASCP